MKTCLVVDDSAVVRKVARHILEALGYIVDEAADGEQALHQCAQAMPDIIVLDENMPAMGGIDFLRALRASGNRAHPYVIFCTADNDPDHIEGAMNAGANAYMSKPFDRETLETKLRLAGVVTT